MKIPFELPPIPEEENTPLVQTLVGIIELLSDKAQKQEEEIRLLKDEIKVLKGEKKRPKFKPSKMEEKTKKEKEKDKKSTSCETKKRAGSKKQSKNAALTIHETTVISPETLPEGSRFKGYRDYCVQDLVISAHNTRYRLECWQTPDCQRIVGQLPEHLKHQHFGPTLHSYILYQHHHCQVTQPLLLEQLREWGLSISSGEIDRLLTHSQEVFHDEKHDVLHSGLASSDYITVDDTGARHKGKNGYVTQVGNDTFAWFESTGSKSRINFLQLLRAGEQSYQVNEPALEYMKKQGLPRHHLERLMKNKCLYFKDALTWEEHLKCIGITGERHKKIATEGALLGVLFKQGLAPELVIVSDDAGQFDVLLHGLCWIHMERLIHTLIPLNDQHRKDIASIRDEVWTLYGDLKSYKEHPNKQDKKDLDKRFDDLFNRRTSYGLLNSLLKRIHKNKSELLLVLERPEIPLHTNDSERDLRDYVKKRKVSGGTRSDLGRQCRDTFISLKKTCRKLSVSFWEYLMDRLIGAKTIPPLSDLMVAKKEASIASGY